MIIDRLSPVSQGDSRFTYVEFVTNERFETLRAYHEHAFAAIGGVPREVLYDNMRTVVVERNAHGQGKHHFHPGLWDVASPNPFATPGSGVGSTGRFTAQFTAAAFSAAVGWTWDTGSFLEASGGGGAAAPRQERHAAFCSGERAAGQSPKAGGTLQGRAQGVSDQGGTGCVRAPGGLDTGRRRPYSRQGRPRSARCRKCTP